MSENVLLHVKFCLRDIWFVITTMIPDIIKIIISRRNSRFVFLFDIPTYSNLGDQAIGYAEELFFSDHFPSRTVIRIPGFMVEYWLAVINLLLKPNDLVVHIGGGNFGDLYPEIDLKREHVIRHISICPIILFPQTIFYSNTGVGKARLKSMQQTIRNQKESNVCILVRDTASYEQAINMFDCQVMLCPDIVLYLNKRSDSERKDVLICMRKDSEKKTNQIDVESVCESLQLTYHEIDTIYHGQVKMNARDQILTDLWARFASSSLVITDRLHGIIFSAITGTPCIALPNNNRKIEDFYSTWLKDVNYIQYVQTENELKEKVGLLRGLSQSSCDTMNIIQYFNMLAEYIEQL